MTLCALAQSFCCYTLHSTQLICHDCTWLPLSGNQISALLIWTIYKATAHMTAASSGCHRCIERNRSTNTNRSIRGLACCVSEALHWLVMDNSWCFFFFAFFFFLQIIFGDISALLGGDSREWQQRRNRGRGWHATKVTRKGHVTYLNKLSGRPIHAYF